MLPYLNNEQLKQLGNALEDALQGATVTYEETQDEGKQADFAEAFITAKRIEGCSEKSLKYYRKTIEALLAGIGKTAQ